MRCSVSCLVLVCALALGGGQARGNPGVEDSTWVDHDESRGPKPPDGEPDFYGRQFHEVIVEPLSNAFDIPDKMLKAAKPFGVHRRVEAVDVNAFDEVPNSSWFTNRNHVRAIPPSRLRQGPDSTSFPRKPWTIRHPKQGGASAGFQVKDADGRTWLIKLDVRGYPGLSSGADMVARTLLHAAGYNVPHNETVRFRRADLRIDPKLERGTGRERLTEAGLDTLLAKGARLADGSYQAIASLYISGHVLGSPSLEGKRRGDWNEWYRHENRRELRGLYVIASWIGFWDTKDANFLDVFQPQEKSPGYVKHYILDAGSSLGADADGVKRPQDGYEGVVDFGWTARRFLTLGFVEEPWRRARQETGIPAVGRFESAEFDPGHFVPGEPDPDYREMTDGDAYWGAKIVASFSDAQIAAAVDAAQYQDPRARLYLTRALIERRDKVARYWFGRVAPLDFFTVRDNTLSFHDLAADLALTGPRRYDVEIESSERHLHLDTPELPLAMLDRGASRASLEVSVAGNRAKAARVELERRGGSWAVTRVRHG